MKTLRLALRSVLGMRSAAIAVIITLVVGILVNITVFTLINADFLRPLNYQSSEKVVAIDDSIDGKHVGVSWGEISNWKMVPGLFEGVAAYSRRSWALTGIGGAEASVVLSGMVTPDFFKVLKTSPLIGRLKVGEDTAGSDQHNIILSYRLWTREFGKNTDVVNRVVALNSVQYRIVAILPADFHFLIDGDEPDVFIPLSKEDYCCQVSQRNLEGIARLDSRTSLGGAQDHLSALAGVAGRSEGELRLRYGVIPLQSYLARGREQVLTWLALAALSLGVIAAFNAGALLLAASLRDARRYAIKISLGATIFGLLLEQLATAAILASIAGLASAVISYFILRFLQTTDAWAQFDTAGGGISLLDWRVLTFGTLISFLAASVACTFPLLILRKSSIESVLRSHSGASSGQGLKAGRTLIVGQVAFSVMLLAIVSSLGHSLHTVLTRDPGFRTQQVVMAGVGVPEAVYDTDEKMISFHERVLGTIRGIPGVTEAAFGAGVPTGPFTTGFLLDGTDLPARLRPRVALAVVSPELFPLLNIPIVRGENVSVMNRQKGPLVAVVNQIFVKQYLSDGRDPIHRGLRIQFYNGISMKPWSHYTIVGVVADTRNISLDRTPEPEIYLSTLQIPSEGGDYFLRTARSASSLTNELPAAIWRIDKQIERVEPVAETAIISANFTGQSVTVYISSVFALIALLLATVGLGSNVSISVSQSTKEIGIRLALGETRASIIQRVLKYALNLSMVGAAAGLVGSIGLSRLIVVSVDPKQRFDLWALIPACMMMLPASALVCIAPLRRSLNRSVTDTLRNE